MATTLKATKRTTTTMATRMCVLLCIWLGLCMTLTDARRSGGGGGGRGTGGGYGGSSVSTSSGLTSSSSTSSMTGYGSSGTTTTITTSTSGRGTGGGYGGSSVITSSGLTSSSSTSSMTGYGSSGTTTTTTTSTSRGVGAGAGAGLGGSRFFLFFGSGHRTSTHNNNNGDENDQDDEEMPLVFIILFWIMVVTLVLSCCFCCAYYYTRNPEYQKSRFVSRVANAKDEVKRQGSNSQNKSAGDGDHNNIGRPPAEGSYVGTYSFNGVEFSTTTNLYFSPNIQDSNTSWCIVGRGNSTNIAMGDTVNACREFTITEGVIAESGHAYWVQENKDDSNGRSLTTGRFAFDNGHQHDESAAAASSNWCSFTGSILTNEGDKAEYTSFQLEKDCVVHTTSSGTTTDLESNEDIETAL
jgi:hypothetical protein